MITKLNISRLLLLIGVSAFLVGCGVVQDSWAGVSIAPDDEEAVYVSYQQFVAKLNPAGERLWVYPDKENRSAAFYAPVTITEDTIYAGDYKGAVHAINRQTGAREWVYEVKGTELGFFNFGGSTDRVIGSVTLGDGVLYVPNEHGVLALNAENGAVLPDWELITQRAVWSQPLYIPAEGDTPAVLFVTSLDHHLYAVDPQTADVLWSLDLEGALPGSPLYDAENKLLFVGTFANEVVVVDPATSTIVGKFDTQGWVWDTPVLVDGRLYFSDLEGYVYAVRFVDGAFAEDWSRQVSAEGKIRAAPLVTEEWVVVGADDGVVYALQRSNGALVWSQAAPSQVLSTLVQTESNGEALVIAATEDRSQLLIGLDLETGANRWTYEHKD